MKIVERLIELGFELNENYYGGLAYVFTTSCNGDRFTHNFAYYPEEEMFYINCFKISGLRTISEAELLDNHNDLNTSAKIKWLEIKDEIKDFNFKICNA